MSGPRRDRAAEAERQPGLFDLPLQRPGGPGGGGEEVPEPGGPALEGGGEEPAEHAAAPPPARASGSRAAAAGGDDPVLSYRQGLVLEAQGRPARPQLVPGPTPRRPAAVPAGLRARLVAAAVDAGLHLAVVGVGALAALLLGVRPGVEALPAFGLFLLCFSFLYSVVTLAFWGRTPGMAAAGLTARSAGDLPLSFGQTGLRWVAGLATLVLAGLPLLVALSGRSLADRLSRSATTCRRPPRG
jgi:hypothetical protein